MANWNTRYETLLDDLRIRYANHQGRGRGLGGRRLSERQYVIARFTRRNPNCDFSDQAIWAKYNRLAGNGGRRNAAAANVRIANKFKSDSFSFVSGFGSDAEMEKWHELFETAGLEKLGRGISRTVWALDDKFVVKIAHHAGARHNTDEAKIWSKNAETADGKYLAPVVAADSDGRWLIMERANCDRGARTPNELYSAADRMDISDIHGGNVGNINGRTVIIDYACGM